MTKRSRKTLAALAAVGLVGLLFGATQPAIAAVGPYCVVDAIDSDESSDGVAQAAEPDPTEICFPTQDLATAYATAGGASTVISIEHTGKNYTGSTLTYTGRAAGCRNGRVYKDPTMGAQWVNVISSARAYGGCNIVNHFEDPYFGGAVTDCSPCGDMGVMDNATSSIKHKP